MDQEADMSARSPVVGVVVPSKAVSRVAATYHHGEGSGWTGT
jgi:hypothetical protein